MGQEPPLSTEPRHPGGAGLPPPGKESVLLSFSDQPPSYPPKAWRGNSQDGQVVGLGSLGRTGFSGWRDESFSVRAPPDPGGRVSSSPCQKCELTMSRGSSAWDGNRMCSASGPAAGKRSETSFSEAASFSERSSPGGTSSVLHGGSAASQARLGIAVLTNQPNEPASLQRCLYFM